MTSRNIYIKNQPLDEARKKWRSALDAIDFFSGNQRETIAVDDSLDRVTAAPVFAHHSSPPYNASAMDGIGVRFADLAGASEAAPVRLVDEQFTPLNTGNHLPPEYDAVVMIEDVNTIDENTVELAAPATPWQHVRTIGEDIVATELILPQGHAIRPIDQGAMLAAGITEVTVRGIPQVAVLPTGSELIQPGEKGCPGQIIEFNSRILGGYLNQWGASAHRCLPTGDDRKALKETIIKAVADHDIVVLNAGASAGTKDFSAQVLAELGEVVVHGVAIKPGKPVILAVIDRTPVIGLPGYPVSATLTLQLFVRELIYRFSGLSVPENPKVTAIMSRPIHSSMGVDQFVRVSLGKVDDNLMATPAGKGAGAVMSLVRADGILTIPAASEGLGAGEKVEIELIRSRNDIESTLVFIGSHDNILDILANELHRSPPLVHITSSHVGSMGGIMAIRRGEAHLAGSHLLDEESGEYNISFIKRLLPDTKLRLINLCYRKQGLIVAKGNPLNIKGFEEIAEKGLSFINRQRGAGTRLLTDKVLADLGISPQDISGYDHEEYTHMSVAAAVAGGSVDSGMGILAAARALDLDFVEVAEERYDLIIPEKFIGDEKVVRLLALMEEDQSFQDKVLSLGGYDLRDCGKVFHEQ